jgi:hypothetical protein
LKDQALRETPLENCLDFVKKRKRKKKKRREEKRREEEKRKERKYEGKKERKLEQNYNTYCTLFINGFLFVHSMYTHACQHKLAKEDWRFTQVSLDYC